jgi:hypothetical protein
MIDTATVPNMAIKIVAEAFAKVYADAARELGLDSLWLVGPTSGLTFRLDTVATRMHDV